MAYIIALLIFVWMLLSVTGCLSFAGGDDETTEERLRAECEDRGGVWTSKGCMYERYAPLDG